MKETDLRYVKTERAIRDAFFELLEESEFDKVSVTDITQRAQINRNTFYLHYSDKFNLVNSILIDFVQELSQQALKVIDQAHDLRHVCRLGRDCPAATRCREQSRQWKQEQ